MKAAEATNRDTKHCVKQEREFEAGKIAAPNRDAARVDPVPQEGRGACVTGSKESVDQEKNEKLPVVEPDGVRNPRAKMVH